MSEKTTFNPWGLPPREAEAMTLLADTGSSKLAADRMGLSPKTVDALVCRAGGRIGARTRMQAIVLWDRARRPVRGLEGATAAELSQALTSRLRELGLGAEA